MKKLLRILALSACVFAVAQVPARAQKPNMPRYTGYVNDYAGILPEKTEYAVAALAGELERKTGAQLAVVTVDSTSPLNIEAYCVTLFETWGIGIKGRDNGVLFLTAVRDRKMRIEVGYGLEGAIPDALAKIIVDSHVAPFYKQGDYGGGIAAGAVGIAKLIAKEYNVELSQFDTLPANTPIPRQPTALESIIQFIFTLFVIILFLSLRMGFWVFFLPGSFRRRGGFWHGGGYGGNSGGFSGGFGGFGGGLSGGGGASGGW